MSTREERRKKDLEYHTFAEEFIKTYKNEDTVPSEKNIEPSREVVPANQVSFEKTMLIIDTDEKENYQQKVLNDKKHENEDYRNLKTELFFDDFPISIGASSVIGKREYQQDSIIIPNDSQIVFNDKPKCVCVLSDGMGGLNGGEKASKVVTSSFFKDYYSNVWNSKKEISYLDFFSKEADIVNERVLNLVDKDGNPLKAGATLIAVAIDGNYMHFLNIGDSRIYLIRNGKILQLTHDQNYLSVLMRKVQEGEIPIQDAMSHPKKEALVSYCGIKELKIKEINLKPIELMRNDVVLMCSDGLYRLLNEIEIVDIVGRSINDMNLAAYKLTAAATNKNHRSQDNTSVILIKFN